MSYSEEFSQPLPVDDNIIVKLPENTDISVVGNGIFKVRGASVNNSTKEFVNKLATSIYNNCSPHLFSQ